MLLKQSSVAIPITELLQYRHLVAYIGTSLLASHCYDNQRIRQVVHNIILSDMSQHIETCFFIH